MAPDREEKFHDKLDRRQFVQSAAVCAGVVSFVPLSLRAQDKEEQQEEQQPQPRDPDSVPTNISKALAVPKTELSMPGPYPGVVTQVVHSKATEGFQPNHTSLEIASAMLAGGMKSLTGAKDERDAWTQFFSPGERVGIKINPVGAKLLSNTHELLHAIIAKLETIGIPKSNVIIWDHFEHMMRSGDFTSEFFPGIQCIGISYQAEEDGKKVWKGDDRLDKDVYYEFDIPGEYDDYWRPLMINTDSKSYFTTILTQMVDKVISMPVLKNSGPSVTLGLKGLSFGSTSNCRRGHAIGHRYMAEVNAFPPLRDKVVLTILDGLRGCWDGGPLAVARYIWNPNSIWISSDPVASDVVGWRVIHEKRVAEGTDQPGDLEKRQSGPNFLVRAENLGLGVFKSRPIDLRKVALG